MAPPSASMDLGQGAVAPLQKEHTDLGNYTKEAENKLKKEAGDNIGISLQRTQSLQRLLYNRKSEIKK